MSFTADWFIHPVKYDHLVLPLNASELPQGLLIMIDQNSSRPLTCVCPVTLMVPWLLLASFRKSHRPSLCFHIQHNAQGGVYADFGALPMQMAPSLVLRCSHPRHRTLSKLQSVSVHVLLGLPLHYSLEVPPVGIQSEHEVHFIPSLMTALSPV